MENYFENLAKSEQEYELEAINQHHEDVRSEYKQEQRMIDREYENERNSQPQYQEIMKNLNLTKLQWLMVATIGGYFLLSLIFRG